MTAPLQRTPGFDGTMAACRKRAAKVMRSAEITVVRTMASTWNARAVGDRGRDFASTCGPTRREALQVLFAALEAMGELP